MPHRLIYLDHNATTPTLPEVVEAMADALRAGCGNPASAHQAGRRGRRLVEEAREAVGKALGAKMTGMDADTVIFTSGGTEANNLALLGTLNSVVTHKPDTAGQASSGTRGLQGHLIISAIEHPSVMAAAERLARQEWRVDRLPVSTEGVVQVDRLEELLSPDTRLVSVMLVNNETGVIQPVREIANLCRPRGVMVHTDAVQAVGKIPVDFRELGVDLMTVAAHKFHGPIGIGALIVRAGVSLSPILAGGFQQGGLRPGTEDVALAVGMRQALASWEQYPAGRTNRLRELRDSLEESLTTGCDRAVVIGRNAPRAPHTLSISFPGLDRQALVMAFDVAGVACSSGSACASGSSEPSATLLAMGLDRAVIEGAIRLSVGAVTIDGPCAGTADGAFSVRPMDIADVQEASRRILKTVNQLYTQASAQKGGRKLPPMAPAADQKRV